MTKYTENKFLPFSPSQLYHIVSDIESYPSFLPWVADASVDKAKTIKCDAITTLEAEICIKFNVYKERFVSQVTLNPDDLKINTTDISGPFKRLENSWCFLAKNNGCQVKFEVDFQFRSFILHNLINSVFHRAMTRVTESFENRAKDLYG